MSISLCMIVKNEENNLPRCLESIKGIVDEMIIVDTGSTDSTIEIAERYGAKIYCFPWNGSFSDARNESMKHAACEWILIMDADDAFEREDGQALLKLTQNEEVEAYFLETVSYVGDVPGTDVMMNLNLRLLRNGKGYFYSNTVHEQLYSNILTVNPSAKILNEKIRFYHYGYLDGNITTHDKRARNISLLEKELEKNPGYPFTLFNLGSEYFAMGDNPKALEYYELAYQNFKPAEGFSSKLLLKMVCCYMHLGRFDEALRKIDEGFRYYPEFSDLEYLRGLTFKWQKKYILALKHFGRCIERGEAPVHLNIIMGAGTYKTYIELGDIFFESEDYESATGCYGNVLKYSPKYTAAAAKLIMTYCRKKEGLKALKKSIEELRSFRFDRFEAMVYRILIEEKYYDLALSYIERDEKKYGVSPGSKHSKGICKLDLRKYGSAYNCFESLKREPEHYLEASCMQAFCRTIQNKYAEALKLLSSDAIDPRNPKVMVYKTFSTLMETGACQVLSEDESSSKEYTDAIFEILGMLISMREFETFEKTLTLLNSVTDKTVLLRLAKLYYKEGSYGLACQELMRSVQLFELIDVEGAGMLHDLKLRGL